MRSCDLCDFCHESISKLVGEIVDARSPEAILVWRIRNFIAALDERLEKEEVEPVITSWTGGVVDSNPFEMLLKTL
jgi:hypothetical protein